MMHDPGHHNVDEMDKHALPEESAAQDRLKAPHPIWDWTPSFYKLVCGDDDYTIHAIPGDGYRLTVQGVDRGVFSSVNSAKRELRLLRDELVKSHEESLELAKVDAKFFEGVQYDEDGYKILKRK